jgi:hypothetical protein
VETGGRGITRRDAAISQRRKEESERNFSKQMRHQEEGPILKRTADLFGLPSLVG